MTLVVRARQLFTGAELFAPGELVVDGDTIVSVGPAAADARDDSGTVEVADNTVIVDTLVPGLVDVHNHGGGGASFTTDPQRVVAAHRAHGTTTTLASLVSQPIDVLERHVTALRPLVASGLIGGIHLEGPWLSPSFRGAHPAAALVDPTADDVTRLLDAGQGAVRMVTIAPELNGAIDAIGIIVARGAVAAVGHTAADYATVRRALAAGATGATHLFNAMAGLHHRSPGPVLALLDDPEAMLELIADGIHLDMSLVAWVMRGYPQRAVLVTDAMSAACCGDGRWQLGDLQVDVEAGVARVAGTSTIAGSTITLDVAVRRAIAAGIPWQAAVRAASALPAAFVGLPEVGLLAPGHRADALAVSLHPEFTVDRVLYRGHWQPDHAAPGA